MSPSGKEQQFSIDGVVLDVLCGRRKKCSALIVEREPTGKVTKSCSTHMMYDRSPFSSYSELPPGVEMGNKATVQVTRKGNATAEMKVDDKSHLCKLKDVLRVPDLGYQLLSVRNMEKLGLGTPLKQKRCHIKSDTGIKLLIDRGVVKEAAINSNEKPGSHVMDAS
eukprot:IDg10151t1